MLLTDTDNTIDHAYSRDFTYTHKNPYHTKLGEFNNLVYRDKEGEEFHGKWNQQIFRNQNPIHLEIGSGYGQFLRTFGRDNPNINLVGMEYRFKRCFNLAKQLASEDLPNIRLLRAKAERASYLFDKSEVDSVYYFFPDPWPKTKHNKKRLFAAPLLKSLHQILKLDGHVFIKTDHDEYYQWMLKHLATNKLFQIEFQTDDLRNLHPEHFLSSIETKFEKIFIKQGIKIKALILRPK